MANSLFAPTIIQSLFNISDNYTTISYNSFPLTHNIFSNRSPSPIYPSLSAGSTTKFLGLNVSSNTLDEKLLSTGITVSFNATSSSILTSDYSTIRGNSNPSNSPVDSVIETFIIWLMVFIGLIICAATFVGVKWLRKKKRKEARQQQQNSGLHQPTSAEITENDYEKVFNNNIKRRQSVISNVSKNGEYVELKLTNVSFPIERIQLTEILGEGFFGKVHKANAWNIGNQHGLTIVAIKMIKNESLPEDKESFKKEIQTLHSIPKQQNIVLFYGYFNSKGTYGLITEYLSNGCLHKYLKQSNEGYFEISLKEMIKFATDIAKGMTHLSFHKFVHRDLAARNVLLDNNFNCKITDFGLTRQVTDEYLSINSKSRLPIRWLAKECLELYTFTTQSDVWAFGIVLWEIFSLGTLPYPHLHGSDQVQTAILKGEIMSQPSKCPDNLYSLMKSCWSAHVNKRPTFPDCLIILETYFDNTIDVKFSEDYEIPICTHSFSNNPLNIQDDPLHI